MGKRISKFKSINHFDNSFSNFTIIKINNNWYNVTEYLDINESKEIILRYYHLRDATEPFNLVKSDNFNLDTINKYKITDKQLINKLNKFNIIH